MDHAFNVALAAADAGASSLVCIDAPGVVVTASWAATRTTGATVW